MQSNVEWKELIEFILEEVYFCDFNTFRYYNRNAHFFKQGFDKYIK